MHSPDDKHPLNVLLVVRWPVGGIRTYLKYVYGHLDPARYRLSLVVAQTDEADPLSDSLGDRLTRCRELPNDASPADWIRAIWDMARSGKADVVHSHGFTAGLLAAAPARLLRIRHVCTVHDVLLARQFQGVKGRLRLRALKVMLPLIDVLQTVGRDANANLLEYFPALGRVPGKVVPIRNGIDTSLFGDTSRRDLRGELDLPRDCFVIGFFGRFMSQKGFRYLVDAVESIVRRERPSRELVVVCFGGGGFIREERSALEKRGLGRYFRFLPFVQDVGPSLRAVDVVAIPSLWEACPLLPMEAMACGTPVIGSDCIGLREVLEDTPATVVPAGDSAALARAILLHLDDPDRRAAAEAFAETARERFDCRHTAQQLESVLWNGTGSPEGEVRATAGLRGAAREPD